MAVQLHGVPEINSIQQFGAFSNLTEDTINGVVSNAQPVYPVLPAYLPPNAQVVTINQTAPGNTWVELPIPMRIGDGNSKMWFINWALGAFSAVTCSLNFIPPAVVNVGTSYQYPTSSINGLNAVFTFNKYAPADTRTLIHFILVCTKSNNYYITPAGARTFTIIAGVGNVNSAPTFSNDIWSLNVYGGHTVVTFGQYPGVAAIHNLGLSGGNADSALIQYWTAAQTGFIYGFTIFQYAAVLPGGVKTITITKRKPDNTTATTVVQGDYSTGVMTAVVPPNTCVSSGRSATVTFGTPMAVALGESFFSVLDANWVVNSYYTISLLFRPNAA